jgi:hypothetical protein
VASEHWGSHEDVNGGLQGKAIVAGKYITEMVKERRNSFRIQQVYFSTTEVPFPTDKMLH